MQTTRKAVRFYIDRDGATPVVRSVPVSRPAIAAVSSQQSAQTGMSASGGGQATAFAASESHRRGARRRLASLVQAPRRKLRAEAS